MTLFVDGGVNPGRGHLAAVLEDVQPRPQLDDHRLAIRLELYVIVDARHVDDHRDVPRRRPA
jgi:hypothetical protein